MDFSDILAALNAGKKGAQDSDPYLPLVGASDTVGKALLQAAPSHGIGEDLLGGLVTGLTGGLFSNLSQGYEANQADLSHQALANALSGKVFEKPDGMSPSVFSSMQGISDAMKLKMAADRTDEQNKLSDAITLKETPTASEATLARMSGTGGMDPQFQQDLIAAGGDVVRARQMAQERDKTKASDKANTDKELGPKLEALNVAKNTLAQMAEAIAGAGNTGPLAGASTGLMRLETAFGLPGVDTEKVNKELGARANLDKLSADYLGIMKGVLPPGRVYQNEIQNLLGHGSSSAHTPAENSAILQGLQQTQAVADKHIQFLKTATSLGHSLTDAQSLLSDLDNTIPLAIPSPTGGLTINPDRASLTPTQELGAALFSRLDADQQKQIAEAWTQTGRDEPALFDSIAQASHGR